jgi:hypothetical protein
MIDKCYISEIAKSVLHPTFQASIRLHWAYSIQLKRHDTAHMKLQKPITILIIESPLLKSETYI